MRAGVAVGVTGLAAVAFSLTSVGVPPAGASTTYYAYVASSYSDTVSAMNPNGSYAHVANYGSNNVSVIKTATNKVIATVNVGFQPLRLAVTPDGSYTYVTNYNGSVSEEASVSFIDTATNTVVANVGVGLGPDAIAIT
jgi:YVTN family beta-propeller protein